MFLPHKLFILKKNWKQVLEKLSDHMLMSLFRGYIATMLMHYVMIHYERQMFSIIMCRFLVNVFYEGTLINNCVSNTMAE